MMKELRAQNIKPQIVFGRWSSSAHLSILTAWMRAPWRVGHVSSGGYKGFCDEIYNFPATMNGSDHEVERTLDLARKLAVPVTAPKTEFPVGAKDYAKADAVASKRGVDFSRLVCLQVGSSTVQAWKRWPLDLWRQVAEGLIDKGFQIAFLGTGSERDAVVEVMNGCGGEGGKNGWVDLCGAMSLYETAAFLARSKLLICNDSGLMHVAAAMETMLISIFGPTEFDRTRPFTDRCVLLRGECRCSGSLLDHKVVKRINNCDRPCLRSITAERVLAEAVKIMS
jgi:ADP-heptose:LPS heptosyltransferase